jgi:hypothetical protein
MAGTRKFNDPAETNAKITIVVSETVDRQLRILAARRGQPVGGIVRAWITAGLRSAGEAGEAEPK